MSEKEKLEIKLELLEDLKECFTFNFTAMEEFLNKRRVDDLFSKYCQELEEINEKEANEPQPWD